jgi:hypothetical protein
MKKSPSIPRQRHHVAPDWLQMMLMACGVLAIVAFIVDLSQVKLPNPIAPPSANEELQTVLLGLGGPRYADSNGLFSVVAPAGWRIMRSPESDFYNVIFKSPNGADMSIMTTPVQYNDLPSLFKDISAHERESGIRTEFATIRLKDRQAIRRTCKLFNSRVLAIDFVADRVSHHILCTAPLTLYDKYEPVFMEIINTYEPGRAAGAGDNPPPPDPKSKPAL